MSRSRVVLIVLFCAALLTPVRAADASSTVLCTGYASCSDKGYSHAGYSSAQHTSYWRMYTGTNCTNYVAYRLVKTNGMPNERPKSGVGNARDWGTTMASITDSTPNVGSVAWWGRTGNHVAYVEKVVSSSEIWVSESNWSGAFDWRRITKSGSGWPDGFIHFADRVIVNETKPSIKGAVKVGSTVSASGSVWTPKGNTYTYRWRSDGKGISGATGKTFVPTAAQLGKPLTVSMTGTRPSYPTLTVTSKAIKVAAGTLSTTSAPKITGTARVDETLTASAGAWVPSSGTTYAYQWLADGTAVAGATRSTFTLTPSTVDAKVTVKVTATRAGYTTLAATSAPTAAVAPGVLTSTRKPSISGTAKVGSKLTASPGTWSKTGTTYAYQWYVDSKAVSGATASTFVPRPADHMLTATVHVTAKRPGYTPVTAISPQTAPIVRGTLTATKAPVITGRARVGSRVTATSTWSHAAELSYRWYAGGVLVKRATERSFVPTARERGAKLRVFVTARADGYSTATARSANSAAVERGHIRLVSQPKVTGSSRLSSVLTISPGTHTPAGATTRYRWLRDGKSISGASGRTYRVRTRDLGHKLSARVTFSAPGYTTRTAITKHVGPAKATSRILVSADPGRRKVGFTIRVSVAGLSAPDGTMRVRLPGISSHTVKIVNGRGSLSLTGQPSGSQTYTFSLSGTRTVTSAERTKTVTIG